MARPWYLRALRWGQTNLTEIDPDRYEGAWWRDQWRRTRVQGVIVNAGGIVAYYPSKYPLHRRALRLGDRDLYGEIAAAAHEDGLAVLARMDSSRAEERFHLEHPDWFSVDADGLPYRAGDLYVACVNSPYYDEYLPGVLREIIERSHPEGVTDNSWSGLERSRICHCRWCASRFRAAAGLPLPRLADWNDDAYRRWIEWSYARRIEIWDANNRVTMEAGGPDCLWVGMNAGDITAQSERSRDMAAICRRARIIMLDSQTRGPGRSFHDNADAGTLIHGLLGWDKLVPESTALYGAGRPSFRVASKPEPEVRMWAVEGFAGGIQPWWHHIGAAHDDRRQYRTAEALFAWHEAHQEYLVDREPVASVGVVWSQRNSDFYGRDAAEDRVALPYRGVVGALVEARIPYLPVHVDDIGSRRDLRLLVLPNVASMSDAQCVGVRRFVQAGGSVLATGETSRYDEWGDPRPDLALGDLLGARATGSHHGSTDAADPRWESSARHTYLRLPESSGPRHPVLRGFEETGILPFGGRIEVVEAASGTEVLATYVPPFPIYPPETSWMRQPVTSLPALIVNSAAGGGRLVYLTADLDRCFGRDNLPDHANLLANVVRWAVGDALPLEVEGRGFIDCHLYRQEARGRARLVLHLVNLTNPGAWRAPVSELIPVGPLRVRVRDNDGLAPTTARLLVRGTAVPVKDVDGWWTVEVTSVTDHEVLALE